jgi:glycosyltransferase involved in cell wall biosynthesis
MRPTPMKILCLYGSTYPWDVRLEKMAVSATAAGHEFHILCANFDRRPQREWVAPCHVRRLPALGRGPAFLDQTLNAPLHANPAWCAAVAAAMSQVRPDLVMARDLHVALLAVVAARAAGVPMVLDLAENWPSLLREWKRFENPSLQNLLLRNAWLSWLVELAAVRAADHIVVVVEEMRERLFAKGALRRRVTVVANVPTAPQMAIDCRIAADLRRRLGPGLKVVYAGEIGMFRGLQLALCAMALVLQAQPDARLVILGQGKPPVERHLSRLARRLGIESAVMRPGWVRREQLASYMAACDIGLAPFRPSPHFDTTMTNKIADYMSIGLPVVATPMRPVRRILDETGAGLTIEAYSPRSMAETLLRLCDQELRHQLGERGREAVRRRYNWEIEGPRFVRCLEEVAALARRRR